MTAVRRSKRAFGTTPLLPKQIVGNSEVRRMCGGITRHTLIRWRDLEQFPTPIRTLDAGELWDAREVQAWLKQRESE